MIIQVITQSLLMFDPQYLLKLLLRAPRSQAVSQRPVYTGDMIYTILFIFDT
ncbi:MAG: hypothetical protein ACI9Y8_002059 [Candidatus Omnitrophota bacterium]|jgi:hypothetical protein